MKKAIFHLKRDHYRGVRTLGDMFHPNGEHFTYVLEDTVRGYGIKDFGNTAIPETEGDLLYKLSIRESPKYGEVVVVYTEEENGMYYLKAGGIQFQMILCHGGNDEEDTMGCLLVNRFRDVDKMSAWGSMKRDMVDEVKKLESEGKKVYLKITNTPQAK